jgi:mono/diheme cytochrome c family protein
MRISPRLLVAVILTAAARAQSPSGNAAHGKELFLSYGCYSCHSFDGHGGAGARLVPMKMQLPVFTAFIRNAGAMPSYSAKVLPDAQAADIWAYIKTLPASPDAKSIPLLQQLINQSQ